MRLFVHSAEATPAYSSPPVCVLATFVAITFTSDLACTQKPYNAA
jgi:hypothetical protein